MSLNLIIYKKVDHLDLTPHLGEMTEHVIIWDHSLYQVLWRWDEYGFKDCEDMKNFLTKAIPFMVENKEELEKYNPESGWSYDTLLKFCNNLLNKCEKAGDDWKIDFYVYY